MKLSLAITSLLSTVTLSSADYILTHPSAAAGGRVPTYADFDEVVAHVEFWIQDSHCPDAADLDPNHWNGPDPLDPTDCKWFKRERNPDSLGSRLLRHSFHDAAGGLDGFVDITDTTENGALDASDFVLRTIYDTFVLSDGYALKNVISLADLSAWAGHAAVFNAAKRVNGNDNLSEDDEIPPIPVKYGRLDFEEVAGEPIPTEIFPAKGGASTGDQIAEYFAVNFNLDERETVTLMGAHTFGGARKSASGYTGMWTQSKNKFNNDYHIGLVDPLPIDCPIDAGGMNGVGGTGQGCEVLYNETLGGCLEPGRCEGWEQQRINNGGGSPQFQWRHSCDAAGDGCTHIMMNVDMGLLIDLEAHICQVDGEVKVNGKNCKKGQVKSFPVLDDGSQCDIAADRILASCFKVHAALGHYIEADANDMSTWIVNFAAVYDKILSHTNPSLGVTLTTLTSSAPTSTPTSSPTAPLTEAPTLVPNGWLCGCPYEALVHGNGEFDCPSCESGICQKRKNQPQALCVRDCKANGKSCSDSAECCSGVCHGDGSCVAA